MQVIDVRKRREAGMSRCYRVRIQTIDGMATGIRMVHRASCRQRLRNGLIAIALSVSGAGSAVAGDLPPLNGYVALMSNYIGRGLAQSVGEPALQAELNIGLDDGLYGGISGSGINWIDQLHPGSSVSLELDGWLGYRRSFADGWTFKGGVLRLQFPGRYAPNVMRPDTTELFGFIGWRTVSAKLNYAITDSFGTPDSRGSWYADLSASLPFGDSWSTGAHIGRKHASGNDPDTGAPHDRNDYTDYKVSLSRHFAQGISVDVAYAWTNAEAALYTLNGYNVAGHHMRVVLQKDF